MRTDIEYLVKIRSVILRDKETVLKLKNETLDKFKQEEKDSEEWKELGIELGQLGHNMSAIQGQLNILNHLLNYDTPLERFNKVLIPNYINRKDSDNI